MPVELPVGVTEKDWTQGRADAPVTLVEYGDFQCGDCRELYIVLKPLLDELGERVRYVYRHLPLTDIHPYALASARMSEAAGAMGQFWPAFDALYSDGEWLTDGDLLSTLTRAGLDAAALQTHYDDPETYAQIRADVDGIRRTGIGHTPTLFVNGVQYEGALRPDELRQVLTA